MKDLKKNTTNINERARAMLNISRDEYALCSYIQYRLSDPRGKKSGWCNDSKADLAAFVGITRPGLYKMMDRLVLENLIEVDPLVGCIRVTAKWVDFESGCKQSLQVDCKQSLQQSVNKVDTECKQSRHKSVNLVTPIYKVELDIVRELEREGENTHALALNDLKESEKNFSLKEEISPSPLLRPTPPSPPDLTYNKCPLPKSSTELKDSLLQYFQANPNEWKFGVLEQGKAIGWTREKIADTVTMFCAHQEAEGNLRRTYGQYKGMLIKWFLQQPRFDATNPPRQSYQTNTTQSVLPKALRDLVGK
jgi:hypothetical protein